MLALVVHLVFLAGIFLLLLSQFLAFAQIVVYAGAVMVIYVFVAAYVGGIEEPMFDSAPQTEGLRSDPRRRAVRRDLDRRARLGADFASGREGVEKIEPGFGTPEAVGRLLLEDFLIAFEAASILLLVAAVAAIVLAGRKNEAGETG